MGVAVEIVSDLTTLTEEEQGKLAVDAEALAAAADDRGVMPCPPTPGVGYTHRCVYRVLSDEGEVLDVGTTHFHGPYELDEGGVAKKDDAGRRMVLPPDDDALARAVNGLTEQWERQLDPAQKQARKDALKAAQDEQEGASDDSTE